jgi:replication-associated recombination protein RarA
MKISDAFELAKIVFRAGGNVAMHGPPGIGKTQMAEDLPNQLTAADICSDQAKLGDDKRPVRILAMNATTMESVDMRGMPVIVNKHGVCIQNISDLLEASEVHTSWASPTQRPRSGWRHQQR